MRSTADNFHARRRVLRLVAPALLVPLVPAVAVAAEPSSTTNCAVVVAAGDLESVFTAASQVTGVPVDLLKAVSYAESRWEQHPGQVSSDGGWGMFNLVDHTEADSDVHATGKGDGTGLHAGTSDLDRSAALTGLDVMAIKSDVRANTCAAASLLASYHGRGADLSSWSDAVARTSGDPTFVSQVWETLRSGQERTTSEGQQVVLAAQPGLGDPSQGLNEAVAVSDPEADCPVDMGCEWIPAPYEMISASAYGNHSKSARTTLGAPSIDYIVIHNTEIDYPRSVNAVTDPQRVAWNYTVRSADGHVANHLDASDVGWHAGNWYVNTHSIGIEHEGYAGTAAWFTESMYRSSAQLVGYLAAKYGVPLDRAHIIGHDQVPGTTLGTTRSMHWDPGPYWDWDHYFELLGAPIGDQKTPTTNVAVGDIVEVVAGYDENTHPITDCEQASPSSGDCVQGAGTNFVLAYQAPSLDAAYTRDPAWMLNGEDGSTRASDISARVISGHKFVVAQTRPDWLGVWWAGSLAWLHNPADHPVVVPSTGKTVTVSQDASTAPLYGRAYPEPEAYSSHPGVAVQALSALEYALGRGQEYVVSREGVPSDYYNAGTFAGSAPGDRTTVQGADTYHQLWFAHRQVFARDDDVLVRETPATPCWPIWPLTLAVADTGICPE